MNLLPKIPAMTPLDKMGLQSKTELGTEFDSKFCITSSSYYETDPNNPRQNVKEYYNSTTVKIPKNPPHCKIPEILDTAIKAWAKRPDGEYGRYVKHLQESIQTHGALKTLFEAKKNEHDRIQADITALTTTISTLTAQLSEIERPIQIKEQDELECAEAIKVIEGKQIPLAEELKKLEEEIATLEQEKKLLRQQVELQDSTISSLERENQELESQLKKQQESDQQKLSALRAKSIETQTDNKDLLVQLLSAVKQMTSNLESSAAVSPRTSPVPTTPVSSDDEEAGASAAGKD